MVQKPVTGPADTNPRQQDSVAEMLKIMQENSERQNQQMMQMAGLFNAQRAVQTKDPMEIAVMMMTAMSGMMGTMMGNIRPGAAGGGMKEALEMIGMVKDLLPDSGGSGSDDNSVASIVKAVAPLAQPLLQMAATQAQNRAATPPAPSAPSSPQPIPIAAPVTRPTVPPLARVPTIDEQRAQWNLPPLDNPQTQVPLTQNSAAHTSQVQPMKQDTDAMYSHLSTLCNFAASGMDPDIAGAEVMKFIPEEMDDRLYELVEDPQCLQKFTVAEPRVAEYADWFERLRQSILASYADDGEEGA